MRQVVIGASVFSAAIFNGLFGLGVGKGRAAGNEGEASGAGAPSTAEALAFGRSQYRGDSGRWSCDIASATTPMSPEEVDAETRAAIARAGNERMQKQMRRAKHKSKGGKLV